MEYDSFQSYFICENFNSLTCFKNKSLIFFHFNKMLSWTFSAFCGVYITACSMATSAINLFLNRCWLLSNFLSSLLTVPVQWFNVEQIGSIWKQKTLMGICHNGLITVNLFSFKIIVNDSLIILVHIIVIWFFFNQSH